jgi:pimeloyl-ACP methyl ester carboxylesterase
VRVEIEPGVRLFFDSVGGGLTPTDAAMVPKPTLLVLHGGPGFDHTSFRPYFDRFADTHQVVYVDQRAQGRSDGADDPTRWNLDTWADDVARFCTALGIDGPAVIGTSFGGFVAMHAAARHPDLVDRLVLMSTAARPHYATTAARFEALGGPEARAAYERVYVTRDGTAEAWMDYAARCLPLYNRTPSPFAADRGTMSFAVVADSVHWFADYDQRDDLRSITAPTLVLVGDDDPMTPVEAAEEIASLLPPGLGRLERFADCGHGTYRDQPERTEAVLRAFLA